MTSLGEAQTLSEPVFSDKKCAQKTIPFLSAEATNGPQKRMAQL